MKMMLMLNTNTGTMGANMIQSMLLRFIFFNNHSPHHFISNKAKAATHNGANAISHRRIPILMIRVTDNATSGKSSSIPMTALMTNSVIPPTELVTVVLLLSLSDMFEKSNNVI